MEKQQGSICHLCSILKTMAKPSMAVPFCDPSTLGDTGRGVMGLERKRTGKEERKTSREGREEGRTQGIVCRLLDPLSQCHSRVQKAETIT